MVERNAYPTSRKDEIHSEIEYLDLTVLESNTDETPHFILRDIPTAKEPKVLFSPSAKQYKDRILVDTQLIRGKMFSTGFDATAANAFAVIFHHSEEDTEKGLRGEQHYHGYDLPNADGDLLYYPVAIRINLPQSTDQLNETLWHEIGHAYQERVKKNDRESLYTDEKIKRTKKIGLSVAVGGAILQGTTYHDTIDYLNQNIQSGVTLAGIAASIAGISVAVFTKSLLYTLDKGEREARKFASEHSHIQPIRKK